MGIPTAALLRAYKGDESVAQYVRSQFHQYMTVTNKKKIHRLLDIGFSGLRLLNEANVRQLKRQRNRHLDREGVKFHIGQVVRETHMRNRGVILEWDRPMRDGVIGTPEYRVLLDEEFGTRALGNSNASDQGRLYSQEQLEETPTWEHRISHSDLDNYFEYYDAEAMRFVPTPNLRWKYPSDVTGKANQYPAPEANYQHVADWLSNRIKGLDEMLAELSKATTASPQFVPTPKGKLPRYLPISAHSPFDTLRSRLKPIIAEMTSGKPANPATAFQMLRIMNDLTRGSGEIVSATRKTHSHRDGVKYSIGQVLRHKSTNLRCVIYDWTVVAGSEQSGSKKGPLLYYFVIPDENDCLTELGGQYEKRYVTEDSLEPLDLELCRIEHDLLQFFFSAFDRETGCFVPHVLNQYMFPSDATSNLSEEAVSCIDRLIEFFRFDATCPHSDLMELRRVASKKVDAVACDAALRTSWASNAEREVQDMLEAGNKLSANGNYSGALDLYSDALTRDPKYVEGWNQHANANFMLDRLEDSFNSTTRLSELVPNHPDVFKQRGEICVKKKLFTDALVCFDRALELNPWATDLYYCRRDVIFDSKIPVPKRERD